MAHYLLTGTAGFIGSRVAALLLDAGHTVTGIDNLNDAYDRRLKDWRLKQLERRAGFRFEHLDISDRAALAALWASAGPFDGVINLAARAGVRPSVRDPWVYYETNVTGTLNLLDLCREHGVPKFVLASSSSVYGNHNPVPFHEDADTSQPVSPYAASKKAAEELCYTYHHLHGLDITVFRYFTVYGPAGRPDMAPFRFVQWISEGRPVTVFGDGTQSRDFTYVDDIARGTLLGLKPLGYAVINLGSDRPVVLMDIIRLIEEKVGRKAELVFKPRHPADVDKTWADISRAREVLGWQTETPYERGFQALIDWYQANRDWAREIETV
ncbi:MAG: SDR family NAD(P)-dependent oxidoreductase [Anaerolineae bacterium]